MYNDERQELLVYLFQLRSSVSMFGSPDTIGVGKGLGYFLLFVCV